MRFSAISYGFKRLSADITDDEPIFKFLVDRTKIWICLTVPSLPYTLYLISAGHSLTTFELTITRLASKVRKIVKEKIRDEDDEDSEDGDSEDSEEEVYIYDIQFHSHDPDFPSVFRIQMNR